jgi:hypothetical protein
MVIRRWVIACLVLGFCALAGIAAVRANLSTQSTVATPDTDSSPKIAGHDFPRPAYPDAGTDDELLSRKLGLDVDGEDDGDDEWLDENPFAPGG